MFVRPSSPLLLECIREELSKKIAPALSDPELKITLHMIDSMLKSLVVRCENEAQWICDEQEEIEQLALAVIAANADTDARVANALVAWRAGRTDSLLLERQHDAYNLAGELLSCTAEAAIRHGGLLRRQLDSVMDKRMQHELAIRGDFALAGRG